MSLLTHYQDITLIPQSELSPYVIWQKLYEALHLGLVEQKTPEGFSKIGVSFPEYQFESGKNAMLGTKLRLFSTNETALQTLNASLHFERLKARLHDYLHFSGMKETSLKTITGYVCYTRLYAKGNLEKLARRMAKRKSISFEKALEKERVLYAKKHGIDPGKAEAHWRGEEKTKNLRPFIQMTSHSTKEEKGSDKNHFRLFVCEKAVEAQEGEALFNSYGLSIDGKTAVPKFK